ncbi:uncharacterized protein LOC132198348 [Neocloeon triangulifer]|uniref:uncharacterized protein LOC132198348 n=1 Tax=Neocloeon triangulifer TaxID=2078957 RepID=UPI00286EEA78|nr:uncharacterized protein LOC132198348 [Neocloeon triangulifer]
MGEIFKSHIPYDESKLPNCSIPDYLFKHLKQNLPYVAEKPWLLDACTGKKVLFGEVEERSRKVASALTRRGFAKGDVLYFVSYDIVDIGVLQLAVWLLGGATRGSFQIEDPEEFARQMQEVKCKFVAVDSHTVEAIKKAINFAKIDCQIINVGDEDLEDIISFSELARDDGAACPSDVKIDPDKDILLFCNTSGSTGVPKGVIHTHKNFVNLLAFFEGKLVESFEESTMVSVSNFLISTVMMMTTSFASGTTIYFISRYQKEEFLGHLLKYKPMKLFLYPYIMSWLAKCDELEKHDFSFLKRVYLGGSVVDPTTLELLEKKFPSACCNNSYGSTETLTLSATVNSEKMKLPLYGTSPDGERMVSSGVLIPFVEAKVTDLKNGELLGRNQVGRLWVRSKHMAKGYLRKDKEPDVSCFDEEGWYNTGDVVFFDALGQLFVRERVSFTFKYYMHFVNPTEIEAVLQEHPAVEMACVIGVPNNETTNLAKGLVVLKEGKTATEEELLTLVSSKMPFYKHLHGGLQFVDSFPENKTRKLDRLAIMKLYGAKL